MTPAIASQRLSARPSLGRLLLVAVMLLAFALQGYATQTHIHKLDGRAGALSLNLSLGLDKSGHTKYPPGDDPVNCALCQQISHAGQYLAPAWLAPFLILAPVSVIETTLFVMPRFDAISHNWRGRGPPRH